jgi:hypothetical protein
MASNITFVGGPGATDVETFNWGGLDFAKNTPVLVDPDAAETAEMRRHYEYMIIKAGTHPALTVEEVTPAAGRKTKAKARDEDLAEDKNGDDDFADDYFELPKDWRSMHHKKLIALARKLGGEDEALATRDGAIAFIEERVALEGNTLHLEHH